MITKFVAIVVVLFINLATAPNALSQITINLPKLPKIGKPKTDAGKTGGGGDVSVRDNSANDNSQGRPKTADRSLVYPPHRPNGTPVLIKNSIYIQAVTHKEYWKMPNQRNYSSWVPKLRFSHFYNNDKRLNYIVEYSNPDGSAWYSERLEQSGTLDAERTVLFQSPSPWGGVIDTKSTAATGIFGFKITNEDTKEVLYQGKFKVGKFGTGYSPQEKNKVDFFVDHDWLMPFGQIGFHHSVSEIGGMPLLVSFWLKGAFEANELEGRIFYQGRQIATTANGGGGVSDYDERRSEFAAAFAPQYMWKRWQFQWNDFLVDNNGTFNRENFPKAFYADKNPGEYTVRIYRGGTQIREMSFTFGSDGKAVAPAYSSQVFMPYYRLVLPAKVIGTAEKWSVNDWKTDAFYGNPVSGFAAQ